MEKPTTLVSKNINLMSSADTKLSLHCRLLLFFEMYLLAVILQIATEGE